MTTHKNTFLPTRVTGPMDEPAFRRLVDRNFILMSQAFNSIVPGGGVRRSGSNSLSFSGTVGTLPKFGPTANRLEDSIVTESGGVITVGGEAIVTGLTASRLLSSDGSKQLTSVADLTSWIAGTTNQITVADDGDGTATLSLPQDIDTGATPTFLRLTLDDDLVLSGSGGIRSDTSDGSDTSTITIASGGSASSTRGAFIQLYGNEHATRPGDLDIESGQGGDITFQAASGDIVFKPDGVESGWFIGGSGSAGTLFLAERGTALADTAGRGQIWVKNDTPNNLYFTDDAGNDRQLVYAGGAFHDGFSDFVANEHIDHTSVTLSAGAGIASAGLGDISASRTIAVDGVLEDLDTLGAAASDGQVIVATGAGVFAYESGATLRTSIGVGTGDSPTLTNIKLSALTDGYLPYHVSDASGLTDSPVYTDGTSIGVGTTSPIVRSGMSGPWLTVSSPSVGISLNENDAVNPNTAFMSLNGGSWRFGKMNDDGTNVTDLMDLALSTGVFSVGGEEVTKGASLKTVETIAALKALDEGVSDYVIVGGYSADGDGGEGEFYWDSSSSESEIQGIIVIPDTSPATGRWKRLFSGAVNVLWTGTKNDGSGDQTSAIQAAIDYFSSGKGAVYFPKGRYRCESTIEIDVDRMHLFGDGMWATEFLFNPSANDILFHFNPSEVAVLDQCSLKYMSITSSDTTYVKTAIKLSDVSWIEIESIAIGPQGSWTDVTKSCIGLHTNGRDQSSVTNLNVGADYPIRISQNPNHSISIDAWDFNDLILFPWETRPSVLIDTGVNLTNVKFSGRQNWVGGASGLEWIDTTSVGISADLYIENLRSEGADDATAYSINIQHNSNLHNLTLVNCYLDSGRKGILLRKQLGVTFIGVVYPSTSREAINIDGTVERVRGIACFWQTGSTGTITNQRTVWKIPENPSNSYDLPTDFILESTTLIPTPGLLLSDLGLTLEGVLTVPNTGLHIKDTDDSHDLIVTPGSDLSADRTLTITTGDSNRTFTLSGNLTVEGNSIINQDLSTDSTGVRFNSLGININSAGDGTLHVNQASAGTVAASANGNVGIFEDSAANGISIITPDASSGNIFWTSPSTTGSRGAELAFAYDGGSFRMLTRKVGGTLVFSADNAITNLTLAGASGSETATFTGRVGVGASPSANADLTLDGGVLNIKETTTPTADDDYGKIYTKTDNKLYFQDGAGTEHEIAFV